MGTSRSAAEGPRRRILLLASLTQLLDDADRSDAEAAAKAAKENAVAYAQVVKAESEAAVLEYDNDRASRASRSFYCGLHDAVLLTAARIRSAALGSSSKSPRPLPIALIR